MIVTDTNKRTITMLRTVLLDAVKANREIHRAEYQEACAAFLERVEADLREAVRNVKRGGFEAASNIAIVPKPPVSHDMEFETIIDMLTYSTSDEITIDAGSFQAYVKNQWPWSKNFKDIAASYKIAGSTFVR